MDDHEWPLLQHCRDRIRSPKSLIVGSVIPAELFDAPCGGRRNIPDWRRALYRDWCAGQKGDWSGWPQSRRCCLRSNIDRKESRAWLSTRAQTRRGLGFHRCQAFRRRRKISAGKNEIDALLRQRHHIRADALGDFRIDNPADVLVARKGRGYRPLEFC